MERNGTSFDVYVGLKSASIRTTTSDQVVTDRLVQWDSASCSQAIFADACELCKHAALSIGTPAIMAVVTGIPQLMTDLLRSLSDQDVRCQKAFGILTGIWGLGSTLVSLNSFAASCRRGLNNLEGQAWHVGPGLAIATVAVVLKVVDIFIHCIIVVPEKPKSWDKLAPKSNGTIGTTAESVELGNDKNSGVVVFEEESDKL
jgi:hypothetical protein